MKLTKQGVRDLGSNVRRREIDRRRICFHNWVDGCCCDLFTYDDGHRCFLVCNKCGARQP